MILVVVDMQPNFVASHNQKTLNEVEKLIDRFVFANEFIIFLEYRGHGSTHQRLLDKVSDYKNYAIVTKKWDSGCNDVLFYCNQNFLSVDSFVICGVNAGACVLQTAKNLAKVKPVIIIQKACNGECRTNWDRFIIENIT